MKKIRCSLLLLLFQKREKKGKLWLLRCCCCCCAVVGDIVMRWKTKPPSFQCRWTKNLDGLGWGKISPHSKFDFARNGGSSNREFLCGSNHNCQGCHSCHNCQNSHDSRPRDALKPNEPAANIQTKPPGCYKNAKEPFLSMVISEKALEQNVSWPLLRWWQICDNFSEYRLQMCCNLSLRSNGQLTT